MCFTNEVVRKSSQENVSTQQITDFSTANEVYSVNDLRKFKVPNKGPFVSTDKWTQGEEQYVSRPFLKVDISDDSV